MNTLEIRGQAHTRTARGGKDTHASARHKVYHTMFTRRESSAAPVGKVFDRLSTAFVESLDSTIGGESSTKLTTCWGNDYGKLMESPGMMGQNVV